MSMREADRLKTIQAVVDRMLRVGQAAERLGLLQPKGVGHTARTNAAAAATTMIAIRNALLWLDPLVRNKLRWAGQNMGLFGIEFAPCMSR